MKLLGALVVIGVLSKVDSRGLENGDYRIINGKQLDIHDYPFMVKLAVGCGGALIAPQVVLTAAHCVFSDNSVWPNMLVEIKAFGEKIAAKPIPHEKYRDSGDMTISPYDIALLHLATPVKHAIAFPKLNYRKSFEKPGTVIQAIGYGLTENKKLSDHLMGTNITILDKDNPYDHVFRTSGDSGTCSGDSGGPAFIRRGQDHILADSRALENGDSRIINGKEMDVNDYPFMAESRVVENGDSRIIEGKEVDVRDYPFMVKLLGQKTPGVFYQCGGTLIAPQVVLTAAHCVVYGRYSTKVFSVTAEIKATGESIEASMLIPHEKHLPDPEHIKEATPYDIALIYLKAPSTEVTIFPKLNEQDFEKVGTVVQVIGYGTTEEKKLSDYLKETQVTISDIDDRVHTFFTVSYNTGTCEGDSGGPAFVCSGQDYILVGVTSGGYFNNRTGLCEYDVPELFTSVKGFGDWIKGNLAILN